MKRAVSISVTPIDVERAYQAVARSISQRVLSGDWPVGMALPGEFALADAFGVHRSTIREAIRVLEQDGLLVRPQGTKQLLVNAPTGSHVAARMTAAIVLQEITFLELWQTMLALEPASAEAAALNASPAEIDALRDNHQSTMRALGDADRLVHLDMEFLDAIAGASHNRALQLCRSALSGLFYPAFLPVMRSGPAAERLIVAHGHILDAIAQRDGVRARDWMIKHIDDFRRGYEKAGLDITLPVVLPANHHGNLTSSR
jgi:DNA-binding FadR family transcriptional regulator